MSWPVMLFWENNHLTSLLREVGWFLRDRKTLRFEVSELFVLVES